MENTRRWVAVFISALLLQACSVSYLQLGNELTENTSSAYGQPCNVKYSISVGGSKKQFIEEVKKRADAGDARFRLDSSYYKNRLKEYAESTQRYIETTQNILNEKRCIANYVEHEEEANLQIRIVEQSGYRGAAAQDWLTGLSLGLIPSWKTEEDVYKYSFVSVSMKTGHSYSVDRKTFAHLVLFPIFWITFITSDDIADYKKALTNFLENS
jgi:hypothetical protein